MYRNGGGSSTDDLESGSSGNYQAMSTQELERRREQDLARQDALLDQIHGGVKGLKNHAQAINGEVVEQNVMIDDIGNVRAHLRTLLCVLLLTLISMYVCALIQLANGPCAARH